jgi:hypothetical protein
MHVSVSRRTTYKRKNGVQEVVGSNPAGPISLIINELYILKPIKTHYQRLSLCWDRLLLILVEGFF